MSALFDSNGQASSANYEDTKLAAAKAFAAKHGFPLNVVDKKDGKVQQPFQLHGVDWFPCRSRKKQRSKQHTHAAVCLQCAEFCVRAGEDDKMKTHAGTHTGNRMQKRAKTEPETSASVADVRSDTKADTKPEADDNIEPFVDAKTGAQRVPSVPFLLDPVIKVFAKFSPCFSQHSRRLESASW